jgi:hypothetical protein
MQDPKEIEDSYKTVDPWCYQNNEDDKFRKEKIIRACFHYLEKDSICYKRALDIGAGEGWITKDLPALEIHGYEISDTAASRFPSNVKRVLEPEGKYDLIIATGVMYGHYDFERFIKYIKDHACGMVVLCNIRDWEVPQLSELGEPIYTQEFPYHEYMQRARIYSFKEKT